MWCTGREARALKLIEAGVEDAAVVLHDSLGRYQALLADGQRACEHEELRFSAWSVVETVEVGA